MQTAASTLWSELARTRGVMTLDAATGDPLWRIDNPDPTILPLAVANGMVIVAGTDQRGPSPEVGFARMRMIDAASGEQQPVVELGQVVFGSVSAPSVAGGAVYILAEEAGVGATILRTSLDVGAAATYFALPLDTHSLVDVFVAGERLCA
ncbi:MAG: PQQ-binding-like beta-propeller repeat protein, partial [Thermomicrobiales bacterium]